MAQRLPLRLLQLTQVPQLPGEATAALLTACGHSWWTRGSSSTTSTSHSTGLPGSQTSHGAHAPGQGLAHMQQLQEQLHTTPPTATSVQNSSPQEPLCNTTVDTIQQGFATSPVHTAEQLADALTPAQKAVLAAALMGKHPLDLDDAYVNELFRAADQDGDATRMTIVEFKQALHMHQALDGANNRNPPNWSALRMVFIASAIPFVGFGFLDNFIMLIAGEEIDTAFGRRLALSTLASAGLGNLVADVIGVGVANGIEQGVKKLPYIKDFKLSKHQAGTRAVKVAKAAGSTIGVMVGCLLGLAPLFYSGTFFTK